MRFSDTRQGEGHAGGSTGVRGRAALGVAPHRGDGGFVGQAAGQVPCNTRCPCNS
jgi:hypothetical protein